VRHTVDVAVSDVRGRRELDGEVFLDFNWSGASGVDIRDN